MTYQWALALALHQLSTIIWVGGMFFAHVALRPTVNELLEPLLRLPLMARVLGRFFTWVWVAVTLLWASGLWVFLSVFGGKAGMHVHAMMGIAAIMTALFIFIQLVPFRRMKTAVAASDWPAAAANLGLIRPIILINLILGMITAVLGAAGPRL